jgi:hypothetical protein
MKIRSHAPNILRVVIDLIEGGDMLTVFRKSTWRLLFVLSFLGIHTIGRASDSYTAPEKILCVSGGVGETERARLKDQSEQFSFWLITAARKTGAYLSGANVGILDAQSHKVIATCAMDGPWLFVNLPSGHFEIETRYRENTDQPEQIIKEKLSVRKNDRRQMIHYFSTSDEVGTN